MQGSVEGKIGRNKSKRKMWLFWGNRTKVIFFPSSFYSSLRIFHNEQVLFLQSFKQQT